MSSRGLERVEFDRTVLPHLEAAWRLARFLVRDAHAAEDVVQDAMVRALTYFPGFRGGDAKSWLLRIVRNVAYDRSNAVRGRAEDPLDPDGVHQDLASPAASPEAVIATIEQEETLVRHVMALPVELREALMLREQEEMSYREIAEVTAVPVGTVMSRLWRARQTLLAAFGSEVVS